MSILAWILVGLIAGALAKLVIPGRDVGGGWLGALIAGVVGALLGGWIFSALGVGDVTGFNLGSILIAFVGAVIVLLIWGAIAGGRQAPRMTT